MKGNFIKFAWQERVLLCVTRSPAWLHEVKQDLKKQVGYVCEVDYVTPDVLTSDMVREKVLLIDRGVMNELRMNLNPKAMLFKA